MAYRGYHTHDRGPKRPDTRLPLPSHRLNARQLTTAMTSCQSVGKLAAILAQAPHLNAIHSVCALSTLATLATRSSGAGNSGGEGSGDGGGGGGKALADQQHQQQHQQQQEQLASARATANFLSAAIAHHHASLRAREVSTVLYSFGRLGLAVDPLLLATLAGRFAETASSNSALGVCNGLWGLAVLARAGLLPLNHAQVYAVVSAGAAQVARLLADSAAQRAPPVDPRHVCDMLYAAAVLHHPLAADEGVPMCRHVAVSAPRGPSSSSGGSDVDSSGGSSAENEGSGGGACVLVTGSSPVSPSALLWALARLQQQPGWEGAFSPSEWSALVDSVALKSAPAEARAAFNDAAALLDAIARLSAGPTAPLWLVDARRAALAAVERAAAAADAGPQVAAAAGRSGVCERYWADALPDAAAALHSCAALGLGGPEGASAAADFAALARVACAALRGVAAGAGAGPPPFQLMPPPLPPPPPMLPHPGLLDHLVFAATELGLADEELLGALLRATAALARAGVSLPPAQLARAAHAAAALKLSRTLVPAVREVCFAAAAAPIDSDTLRRLLETHEWALAVGADLAPVLPEHFLRRFWRAPPPLQDGSGSSNGGDEDDDRDDAQRDRCDQRSRRQRGARRWTAALREVAAAAAAAEPSPAPPPPAGHAHAAVPAPPGAAATVVQDWPSGPQPQLPLRAAHARGHRGHAAAAGPCLVRAPPQAVVPAWACCAPPPAPPAAVMLPAAQHQLYGGYYGSAVAHAAAPPPCYAFMPTAAMAAPHPVFVQAGGPMLAWAPVASLQPHHHLPGAAPAIAQPHAL